MHRVLWFHLAYSVCKRCIVRLQLVHIELPVPSLSFITSLFACKPSHASNQTGHWQLLLGNSTFTVYQRRKTNASDAFAVCKQITFYGALNNQFRDLRVKLPTMVVDWYKNLIKTTCHERLQYRDKPFHYPNTGYRDQKYFYNKREKSFYYPKPGKLKEILLLK